MSSRALNIVRHCGGLVTVTLLIMGIVLSMAPSVRAVGTSAMPMISFTFDDGMTNAYTLAAPALQKYGYSGTDYVVPDCVGMSTAPNTCKADPSHTYMTWDQVKGLHSTYGWEIGSHTQTHPYLASTDPEDQPVALTEAQVEEELSSSKQSIISNTGITPTAFATPYGDYDPAGTNVLSKIAKYYTSHRGFADIGYNVYPYNDYLLVDQPIQGDVTVDAAKAMVDQAIATNTWLIMTFHEIVSSGASTARDDYQYNVADLEAIAAYAKSKSVKGVNVSEGIVTNPLSLVSNYTFDAPVTAATNTSADAAAWTTDALGSVSQDTTTHGSAPSSTNSLFISSLIAGQVHAFSPQVAVTPKPYIVKTYVNIQSIGVLGELAFYIDEYDANGTYVTTQYNKSWSIFNAPNPLVREHSFVYTPTTTLNGATVSIAKARLQLVAVSDTGITCYVDNVLWFAQDGSTVPGQGSGAKVGDVNGDTVIDALDLSMVLSNWDMSGRSLAQGNLNGDAVVDALDLSIVLSNWGK